MQDLYTVTVPVCTKMLGGLKGVLTKAEAYAKEHDISEETFLNDALAPDMFPLKKQVQVACDNAKGAIVRLAGKENVVMEDTEATFADLKKRIDATLAFIGGVTKKDFEGAEDKQVTLPYFPGKYMTGAEYALEYVVPNFLFHVTVAYAIVRKNGVSVGKADYINTLPLKDL